MFSKNKKKPDSKIRWQSTRFKERLNSARNYKRPGRAAVPQSSWGILLSKVGLGSWVSRFVTLLVFLFLVYLVFIPNFFFVKQINVTGGDLATRAGVQDSAAVFLAKSLPWPQKNLLLMSKTKLKNYLLANDQKILSVNSIDKHLPSTLNINITPRIDEFLIQIPPAPDSVFASTTYYSVSNDGLVTGQVFPGSSGTLPSLPFLIKVDAGSSLAIGQSVLPKDKLNFIEQLPGKLSDIVKSQISSYEVSDLQTPDLTVHLNSGFKVLFDLTSDINQALGQLKLLFGKFSAADISKLYYVDMRFTGRSYLCDKGAACVNNLNLPQATTTPSIGN